VTRKDYASTSAGLFPFQVHNAEPSDKEQYTTFGQHLLQFTVTDAVFAVPAYFPQDDVLGEMTTSEYVHEKHRWQEYFAASINLSIFATVSR
jgi:hypothetical protein